MSNARLNNGGEVLVKLGRMWKYFIPALTPVENPTTAPILVDDDTLTVTPLGDYTTGNDVLVVGTGGMDLLTLGVVPGSGTIPLVGRPAVLAQDTGAIVSVATKKDLGYIEDAGGTLSASATKSPIGAANAAGPIAYLDAETGDISFGWSQRESSLRNIAQSFGADEDSIRGTGVANDPYRLIITSDTMGLAKNFCLRIEARKYNGKIQCYDLLNCAPEVAVTANIVGKGSPTVWGASVKCIGVIPWDKP